MTTITYRQALNSTLGEELERDPKVLLMGEEIGIFQGSYRITEGLLQRFGPKRVVDAPIAEEGFVGVAIGAAMLGLRPVVEIMTINFILVAIDQVVNHASKIHYMFGGQVRVPLVIRTPSGGTGQLAATHSQSFENWFAYCPGLKVVAPATPYDAKGLLRAAIRDDDPVIFIESLALYDTKGEVPDEDFVVPIGVAEVKRAGHDVTVVAYSRMTAVALQVAQRLAEEGISVEVVDLRSLRPLDRPTIIASVKKTNRAVVIAEDWYSYGVTAELAATIQEDAFDYLDAPVQRVAGLEVPLPYAKDLSAAAKPSAQSLINAIHRVLHGTRNNHG
ncbi:alpha-ketoacid dehydrogenase subunit beta [Candidatus Viridilinea mediisalina]|uniref:Alpha-ketoacid dehydrogenase subunit beta n=1 Tax=Candidatus Viridilinea mediisalina TaxID=2024553 RepID=A0A2A6RE47_9CHLR|nr:alpha-ketoacid dehydrogenase subunit beta [Candidatus Viridilinea mediisalina]PDW00535.1 alpha-ketoacid dehydrogenase subunit beta [Candidatus Viridilinea mediisalina]